MEVLVQANIILIFFAQTNKIWIFFCQNSTILKDQQIVGLNHSHAATLSHITKSDNLAKRIITKYVLISVFNLSFIL